MIRKPKNIFLHFLNRDTQEIFNLNFFNKENVKRDLKKCINASILLCDENTFCIVPLGFWFESEYTRELLNTFSESIDLGYIRFSMREENVREYIDKKREKYSPFVNHIYHDKVYDYFFEDEIFNQLIQLNPRLIDRKTKIGRRCADIWIQKHNELLWDNSGELRLAYSDVNNSEDRNKIATIMSEVVLDPEKPFIWGSVKEKFENEKIRHSQLQKKLRIQFEKEYYLRYLEEYNAVNLYNFILDKGIDFNIEFANDSIANYIWIKTYFDYIGLSDILSISDRKLVKVKESGFWWKIFSVYIDLCNKVNIDSSFSQCLENVDLSKELKEAVIRIKEILSTNDNPLFQKEENTMDNKKKCMADVLVMVATREEEEAITSSINGWEEQYTENGYNYYVNKQNGLTYALARSVGMGLTDASIAAQYFSSAINPRFFAMAGFCAGRKGKVNLGDIVVPEKIYQYDTGKQLSATEELPSMDLQKINPVWLQKIERFGNEWRTKIPIDCPMTYERQMKVFIEILRNNNYQANIINIKDNNHLPYLDSIINDGVNEKYLTLNRGDISATEEGINHYENDYALKYHDYKEPELKIRTGALATGNKVQQWDQIFEKLERQYERKTYALDMEGFAFAETAWFNRFPSFLVAKGVGDFASGNKKFDNRYIAYSTVAAFMFLVEFFNSLNEKVF